MASSTSSRPLTRSQTSPSVLGKRTTRASTRSSSMSSNASVIPLPTPESTPKIKRVRTSVEEVDPNANKENIPPLSDEEPESPTPLRLTRRPSVSSNTSATTFEYSATTPRRQPQAVSPQTPATALSRLTLATPPPTPPVEAPLHLRIRGLLRATVNAPQGMSMMGREKERNIMESFLHSFDEDQDIPERVLYVSGSPGTGKTALVNSIISKAKLNEDVKIFFFNCMALTSMDALWQRLGAELSAFAPKTRSSKSHTTTKSKLQGREFVTSVLQHSNHLKLILVLDELDSLSKTSSATLQSIFSLSVTYTSIRIIGIANTHTLTSSSSVLPSSLDLSGSSNACDVSKGPVLVKTVHFAPYTSDELLSILRKRLEPLPQGEVQKFLPTPTLIFLTKKVSSLTGDVRVLFETLRGAIDLAAPTPLEPSSPSDDRDRDNVPKSNVAPSHILAALKAHTPSSPSKSRGKTMAGSPGGACNSEIVSKVRNLNLQARLVLLAVVLASKRSSSGLSMSASSPVSSKLATLPTKRSPMKRTISSAFTHSGGSESLAPGIDTTQLHAYYSALLASSGAFHPVSRPDFMDVLGLLETTGLLSLHSTVTRAFKRSTSFTSGFSKGKSSSNASGTQHVSLPGDVREVEVSRGLGIDASPEAEGDALEEDVRNIWVGEMQRIGREVKAQDASKNAEEVYTFDDAIESC